jgi:hypothetical protein
MNYEIFVALHISLAIASLATASFGVVKTYQKQLQKASSVLKQSRMITVATVMSGVALSIFAQQPLLATCVSLFSFIAAISILHAYHALATYKKAS